MFCRSKCLCGQHNPASRATIFKCVSYTFSKPDICVEDVLCVQNSGTTQSVVLSLTAAIHDSSYRRRCYTDHKQTNKQTNESGLLGRDAVATDVSKAGSFLFTCLTLKIKAVHSSETRKQLTQRYDVTSQKTSDLGSIALRTINLVNIHSFCCLPHGSITSPKASSPQRAIYCLLFQFPVSSRFIR
jgi:hypothetical protein